LMPNDIAGRIHAILQTHNHRVPLTSDVALGADVIESPSKAKASLSGSFRERC
jgi:hypothetical protein